MESTTPSEPRLRALLEAGLALSSELSLDSLLERLTELSAELTGARYAALGVARISNASLTTASANRSEPRSVTRRTAAASSAR